MRLYNSLFKSADGFSIGRYTVAVQGGGYFEGVKSLGDFSPESICLRFSHALLEVVGENLVIAKFIDGDLQIDGKITGVRQIKEAEER